MKMTAQQYHLHTLIFQQISGEVEGGPQWTHGRSQTWGDIVVVLQSCLDIAQSNLEIGLVFPSDDGLPVEK